MTSLKNTLRDGGSDAKWQSRERYNQGFLRMICLLIRGNISFCPFSAMENETFYLWGWPYLPCRFTMWKADVFYRGIKAKTRH